MQITRSICWGLCAVAVGMAALALPETGVQAQTQGPSSYRLAEPWAKMPQGREIGAVGKLTMSLDGNSIWAVVRCGAPPGEVALKAPEKIPGLFGTECLRSDLDSVIQFDLNGNVMKSFGSGLFIWPHGIGVDPDGNIWVTDAVGAANIPAGDKRGQQVVKFSPDGKVLLTIGTPGVGGGGKDRLTSPSDLAFTKEGDVLIADGHNNDGNNRVIRFTKDGKYVSEFGKTGWAPGEFRGLHAIAVDDDGRIYVGDRGNNRIQLFKPDGSYINTWYQFGKPSGIFIRGKTIYVADSESDNVQNPGFEMGIRIGEIDTGWVRELIVFPWGNPNYTLGTGAEFVTVDRSGNIYGGEPVTRNIQKYFRVRP
jgi:DNA-binding beta-propeller fold protein YncE